MMLRAVGARRARDGCEGGKAGSGWALAGGLAVALISRLSCCCLRPPARPRRPRLLPARRRRPAGQPAAPPRRPSTSTPHHRPVAPPLPPPSPPLPPATPAMTSIGTGYDLSASTYSPDGRIFQVRPHAAGPSRPPSSRALSDRRSSCWPLQPPSSPRADLLPSLVPPGRVRRQVCRLGRVRRWLRRVALCERLQPVHEAHLALVSSPRSPEPPSASAPRTASSSPSRSSCTRSCLSRARTGAYRRSIRTSAWCVPPSCALSSQAPETGTASGLTRPSSSVTRAGVGRPAVRLEAHRNTGTGGGPELPGRLQRADDAEGASPV